MDHEGISGTYDWENEKEDAKRMTRDLNIVLNTIKEDDIYREIDSIVVADSHGGGKNLSISNIECEKAYLVSGANRNEFMMQGLDDTFDACFLIGYHSRGGEPGAILDHTYSNRAVKSIRINDKLCGETEINSYFAGYFNIPVILVSGDDKLEKQVYKFFDSDFPYALVKKGISKCSSILFPDVISRANLEDNTLKALDILKNSQHKRYIRRIEDIVKFSITFKDSIYAYNASIIPWVSLIGGDTIEFELKDYRDAFRLLGALLVLSRG